MHDWSFYFAAIPAVLALGLAKGGFNMVGALATPIMALAPGLSPVTAAAILLPLFVAGDVLSVWFFRKDFSGRNVAIMLPGAVAGIAAGAVAQARLDENWIKLGVGIISVGFVAVTLLRDRLVSAQPRPADVPRGVFWGAVAGFTSAISHSGAPPFQVYVLPQRLTPAMFAGTATMFFAAVNAIKVPAYFLNGQLGLENLKESAILLPFTLGATMAGVWIVRRIATDKFYGIILTLTFVFGVWLIRDALKALHVIAF